MALFKNKESDKKRKGESVIGKIIYGFLLFAPLMSILFTSLYTVFNKNAYESYYGENINETNYITIESYDNFKINDNYTYRLIANPVTNVSNSLIYYDNFQVIDTNIQEEVVWTNYDRFNVTWADNRIYLNFYGTDLPTKTFTSVGTTLYFSFRMTNYAKGNNLNVTFTEKYDHMIQKIEHNKYSYLDNSFEYGMYKTEQSNIYNWSKTTGTYTVLQNVCTGIGINNTFVPMLMAYWLLISIIYFLFDIALILIWAVHDKIHALKDAI